MSYRRGYQDGAVTFEGRAPHGRKIFSLPHQLGAFPREDANDREVEHINTRSLPSGAALR
jgi:hypothetical protein